MAINKNFVIKNGLEVNTNVLVAAAEESQVGVGTTRPYYKLHVGGGEGNRGGIGATDITVTGIATVGVANSDSGAFRVLGISTFQGDLDLLGSAGVSTVRWDASKDALTFVDNASARFGTGEDLRIWHDGSNSYISDQGDGSLIIYGTDETLAVFTDDGSVQLYNNNTKRLETTGLGVTVYGDLVAAGVGTFERLRVTGISTFGHDTNFTGTNGSLAAPMAQWNHSGDALEFRDNAAVRVGTGSDLAIFHDGSNSYVRQKTTSQNLFLQGDAVQIRSLANDQIIETNADGAVQLFWDNTERLSTTAIGATVFGDFITSGVGTFGKAYVTGIATFASDVNVLGNLNVTGDITYDEVTGRNLNISGFSTFADDVLFNGTYDITWDKSESALTFADWAPIRLGIGSDLAIYHDGSNSFVQATNASSNLFLKGDGVQIRSLSNEQIIETNADGAVELFHDNTKIFSTTGAGITVGLSSIQHNGNAAFPGIVTAGRYIGIHTSADGGGIGIGSTSAHVGYGFTYIDFKGPGVSTVYASAVTGITTIYFQGGGGSSVGAAGTWQNDGAQGISTAKSVGINTVGVAVTALQGGEKGASSGIGQTFQGLYISNGMVVNDNQLNGNHYIGTAFGGVMAGPVTVNGVITVDGNWAVV